MLTWFGGERNVPEIPHCAQKFLFHPGHSARNDARPAIEEVPAGALPESTVTAQRPDAPTPRRMPAFALVLPLLGHRSGHGAAFHPRPAEFPFSGPRSAGPLPKAASPAGPAAGP